MKKTIALFIIIFILTYFVVGSVFVLRGWLNNEFYTFSIGIISSCASVVAIYNIINPSSLRNELGYVQPSLLKEITNNFETINNQKKELEDTKNKFSEQEKLLKLMEIRKNEFEIIIKKASLAIFLNDQLERSTSRLKEIIERNSEIIDCIENRKNIENKLTQLNEEIQRDDNYELLYKLLKKDDYLNEIKPIIFSNVIIKKMYSIFYEEFT